MIPALITLATIAAAAHTARCASVFAATHDGFGNPTQRADGHQADRQGGAVHSFHTTKV